MINPRRNIAFGAALSLLLLAFLVSGSQARAASQLPSCFWGSPATRAVFGAFEKQSLLGRSCLATTELAVPEDEYTGLRYQLRYSATGSVDSRLSARELPLMTGLDGSTVIKPRSVLPEVSFDGLTYEASAVFGSMGSFDPDGLISQGQWSDRHVSDLELRRQGSALVVTGRVPAICHSCNRVIALSTGQLDADGQPEPPVVRGRFPAVEGYVSFYLVVPGNRVDDRHGARLELQAPVFIQRGKSLDAPWDVVTGTDLELLVEHRGSGLSARAVYPWTANHKQTLQVEGEAPVSYLLTLSGFDRHSSSCCRRLALKPDFDPARNEVTLRWPRLLLPGQGQRETLTAVYADGHQEQLLNQVVRRG